MIKSAEVSPDLHKILTAFENESGLENVDHEFRPMPGGDLVIVGLANPTERFYKIAEDIKAKIPDGSKLALTIARRTPPNQLQSPEARYFLRVLSEALNISRQSFKDDFFDRYTKSVSNAEAQITAAANHIVFGRRGAGKSSLLLYALRTRERERLPSIWLDMQVYEKRNDSGVILDVIVEILHQLKEFFILSPTYLGVLEAARRLKELTNLSDEQVRRLLPDVRTLLLQTTAQSKGLFIFLDDFHVLNIEIQPRLLGQIYSITRGMNLYLKISAIETLTKSWDAANHSGLQLSHDVQPIKLDYNLTMPDKAATHIEGILDAHAVYCGLPSVRFLCTSGDVLSRLVWVSAGVPRDALSLFAQAMAKGAITNSKQVSVTSVNLAASEMVSQKMRDLETDVPASETENSLSSLLERVKDFCIKQKRKNAFLVEIINDDRTYQNILKLVDLRLVHVINEGITVGEAGRKYLALILDYGFYTGIRAAQSVDLFNKQTQRVTYKELRRLPVFQALEAD